MTDAPQINHPPLIYSDAMTNATKRTERRQHVEAVTGQPYTHHLGDIHEAGLLATHQGSDAVYLDVDEDEYCVLRPDNYGRDYVFIGTVRQIRQDLRRCGVAVAEPAA